MNEKDYIIIDSKLIYNGQVKLRLDTFRINGKMYRKEVIEHNASVGIIPIINNDEIMLIKQYRHAVNEYLIEIPAGKIENAESPIEAAKRELEEETGFEGDLIPMTQCYLAPSYDTELMYFFIAKNISKIDNSLHMMDNDENISNIIVKLEDALHYCFNGIIKDCKTVSAILLYHTSFLKIN
ncbi:MAG: NUDIX hydrolase [Thermoproteota archaeon]|nr:NUDIX hydrolase [Thermoproteota archaeon]